MNKVGINLSADVGILSLDQFRPEPPNKSKPPSGFFLRQFEAACLVEQFFDSGILSEKGLKLNVSFFAIQFRLTVSPRMGGVIHLS